MKINLTPERVDLLKKLVDGEPKALSLIQMYVDARLERGVRDAIIHVAEQRGIPPEEAAVALGFNANILKVQA